MPKRRHDNEEKWERKIKKYERKLEAKRCVSARRIIYSDEEDDVQTAEHIENNLSRPVECFTPEPVQENSNFEDIDPGPSDNLNQSDQNPIEEANLTENESFDLSLVQVLGNVEPDTLEFGDNIHEDVVKQFEKILQSGLNKESKEELLKKYLFPKNLPLVKSPELNPEINGMLAEVCKVRDKRLLTKQTQLGKTLSALGKAITSLLKKSPDIPEIIRTLNDAGKLLADSHFTETDTLRSVIIPLIDKTLAEPFRNRKRDTYLFGDNLGDLVKNSRGIKRTSQMIQSSSSTSSNHLNGKGPSTLLRNQRVAQTYSYRTGGPTRPTASYTNYRRSATLAPPPAPWPARRQPPPAPPARRQPGAPARRQPAQAQRSQYNQPT